ncbi:LysR family transcriptional regulator [Acidocella sp. KAb 2-4]|uniref:LysR family transcriptional regulator n=1 Tax=Acidocella sp. KAb 2-4 TaxID=2885158 RepID=UPI001D06FBF1|nr:LysR family transcriptional regulator [Acidocella sp. KAb 2-4]MCB5944249.1 LysR family transcriptional regulator [Acidocella sp. KAb 2-4]
MQLRDFDINLLNILEAIWLTRSVSVAARRLNLGQSTISAALNRLRDQLNDELFVWNGHEMVPTPVTEQLMPLASDVLSRVRTLLEKASGAPLSVERNLVIASVDFVVALYGAELITRAMQEAPNLKLDFVTLGPAQINKTSITSIDLFIFPANAVRIAGVRKQACYVDEYVCIANKDNQNIFEGMDVEAFLTLPHIGFSAMPRMIFSHEAISWQDMRVEPNYRMLMPGYASFPDVVAESDVVAIVPKRFALKACAQGRVKWINTPVKLPELDFAIAWNPTHENEPAQKWLRDTMRDIMQNWAVSA